MSQLATLADLARYPGKAELIAGKIVPFRPVGRRLARIIGRIAISLDNHARRTGRGEVYTSTLAFAVPALPTGRESFSPDTSYYDGPFPSDEMTFIEGAPNFAAEVRSESDYGPAAEIKIAAKREDYFQAGTFVVWDVDTRAEEVRCWVRGATAPQVFVRGQVADAEPAVPGWTINVDEVFA